MKRYQLKLKGQWHKITYEEAYNGHIGMLFFKYLQDKEDDLIFYGILSHDHHQGFSYYIGTESLEYDLAIDENCLLYTQVDNLQAFYDDLIKKQVVGKALFASDHQYCQLPVKIEKYHLSQDSVNLVAVLIAQESQD